MRFLTSTVFLALLAASVAHPTNDQLVLEVDSDRNVSKKACTIKQPDILQYLYQGLPDYTFPNLAGKGGYFRADSRFAPNGEQSVAAIVMRASP